MLLDREAVTLAREARDELTKLLDVLAPARARLREWSGTGYPTGGSEGSSSADSHSDPVARAIQTAERRDDAGNFIGWHATDPCADSIRRIDKQLAHIRNVAARIVADLTPLIAVPLNEELAAEGCILCDHVRLPLEQTTGKAQHACSAECASNDHRHPAGFQSLYSRRAPANTELRDLARCSWHYDFAERHQIDAPAALSLWHLEHLGRRVPEHVLREHVITEPERTCA